MTRQTASSNSEDQRETGRGVPPARSVARVALFLPARRLLEDREELQHKRVLPNGRQRGIDHTKFSVKYQGLDMRLTGVEASRVVKDVLA